MAAISGSMKSKRRRLLFYLPAAIVIAANSVFIFAHLGGKAGRLPEAGQILADVFWGPPAAALAAVLIIFLGVGWRKKSSRRETLRRIVLAVLLFFMATNFSLFRELGGASRGQESARFQRKTTPRLEEVVRASPATLAGPIGQYLAIGEILRGKTLFLPRDSEMEELGYLLGFIDPGMITKKTYAGEIGKEGLAALSAFPARTFRAARDQKTTDTFVIIDSGPLPDSYSLLRHGRTIYFVPPEALRRLSLDVDD